MDSLSLTVLPSSLHHKLTLTRRQPSAEDASPPPSPRPAPSHPPSPRIDALLLPLESRSVAAIQRDKLELPDVPTRRRCAADASPRGEAKAWGWGSRSPASASASASSPPSSSASASASYTALALRHSASIACAGKKREAASGARGGGRRRWDGMDVTPHAEAPRSSLSPTNRSPRPNLRIDTTSAYSAAEISPDFCACACPPPLLPHRHRRNTHPPVSPSDPSPLCPAAAASEEGGIAQLLFHQLCAFPLADAPAPAPPELKPAASLRPEDWRGGERRQDSPHKPSRRRANKLPQPEAVKEPLARPASLHASAAIDASGVAYSEWQHNHTSSLASLLLMLQLAAIDEWRATATCPPAAPAADPPSPPPPDASQCEWAISCARARLARSAAARQAAGGLHPPARTA
ncbi:hypothetical protein AB1Y20_016939 [Prymnesium parvum]|uniref:Uncharacterized protein n=1 Tax=Prymnesium parvum TaxID=97485 RepID=A0AB34ICL1_PRYPA